MGIVSSALCCACTAVSCTCSLVSCCFTAALPGQGGLSIQTGKIFYMIFLAIATAFALSFRYTSDTWEISWDQWTLDCNTLNNVTNVYCQGDAAAYRISFVLALFFLVHIPFACCGTKLHRGFWFFKVLVFLAGIVGALFIPNTVFDDTGYAWVARVVSTFYLIFQVFLLLGFAYDWNDKWVQNADAHEGSKRETGWLAAILVCSFVLYALSMTGIVFLFKDYTSCTLGKGISSWTFLSVILVTVLSLFREQLIGVPGAILPAAVISGYVVFLGWDALESDTDPECEFTHSDNSAANVTISILITTLSLIWAADRTSSSFSSILQGDRAIEEDPNDERAQVAKEKERSDREERTLWCFHLVMAVISMYMAMVVTNWGTLQALSTDEPAPARGSTWVKLISQILTVLLYVWTLVAPKVFPDRDYSIATTKPSYSAGTAETQLKTNGASGLNLA
mmetsp:Transcript_11588/g.13328  ORF Transcript_11588/g.13328 Transcript_11588/m.13328 type:complete len:452 (-) Transcript_11588:209-1564(-)